MLIFRIG